MRVNSILPSVRNPKPVIKNVRNSKIANSINNIVPKPQYSFYEKLKLGAISLIYGSVVKDAYVKLLNEEKFPQEKTNDKITLSEIKENLEENGFSKNIFGDYSKSFSKSEYDNLQNRLGYDSRIIREYYYNPMTKLDLSCLKDFIELGKEQGKKLFKEKFNDMFIAFNTVSKIFDYKTLRNCIMKNNSYYDLIKNIVENPVDKDILYSFDRYKNNMYTNINDALREKTRNKDYKIDSVVQNHIDNISNYIDTQNIKKPITVYRVEGLSILNHPLNQNGEKVNLANMIKEATQSKKDEDIQKVREFVLNNELTATQSGFLSTSINKKISKQFLEKSENNILWHLKTKPNTKGVFIEGINYSLGNYENEVLMQKNSQITIKDLKYNKKEHYWDIFGEISN